MVIQFEEKSQNVPGWTGGDCSVGNRKEMQHVTRCPFWLTHSPVTVKANPATTCVPMSKTQNPSLKRLYADTDSFYVSVAFKSVKLFLKISNVK